MKKKYKFPKKIAMEKINHSFEEAKAIFKKDPEKANKYVARARQIAMKNRIRIPASLQRRFCKHCYSFLMPGVNCRVRNQNKKMVYYCLNCKKFMRFHIKG